MIVSEAANLAQRLIQRTADIKMPPQRVAFLLLLNWLANQSLTANLQADLSSHNNS